MRAPDVVSEPAEVGEVLDGRRSVQLHAVRLLLAGLGEVRVQRETSPAGELGGLRHQPLGNGERRARCDGDLDPGSGACLVKLVDEPLRVRERRVDVLHELVGRKAAVRHAEVHRAA